MRKLIVAYIIYISCFSVAVAGDITIPPISESILDNGLEIVFIENHELPVVYLKMVVGSGSFRDPEGKEGLASFTAEMLKKGAGQRSAVTIAEEMDFVGGSINVNAGRDVTYITVDLLKKHINVGLELLSDIMLNPVFDSGEIERYRKQVLNSIIQSKEDPSIVCAENFDKLLFGRHPYGHPVRGEKRSIESISREDIAGFYDTFIRPNNSFLVVAGDIEPKELLPSIKMYFGPWKSRPIPVMNTSTPAAPDGRKILLINKPDATQTHIRFGGFGITRDSEHYYPFMVMNYVLGSGLSFVNRLMSRIRDEGGLTYDIRTVNEWNTLPGAFYCNTSTENDSTLKAIETALKIMNEIVENGVSDEEYEQAMGFYTGYYPISLETPTQWANEIIKVKMFELPKNYIRDFTGNIMKVRKSDIKKAARAIIDTDNIVICVVSNADDVLDDLETLGKVTVVNLDDL